MINLLEKLKDLKKNWKSKNQPSQWQDSMFEPKITKERMNEVFFYDPYRKNEIEIAIEGFRMMQKALIQVGLSCDELVKGTRDAMRHMGKCSGKSM